jgi:hypothetical protein
LTDLGVEGLEQVESLEEVKKIVQELDKKAVGKVDDSIK